MTPEFTVLVPTRSRPQNGTPMIEAWQETGAFDEGAELVFILDEDDPTIPKYVEAIWESARFEEGVTALRESLWRPLVPKLNRAAVSYAELGRRYVGFMGDDHRPRSQGWAGDFRKTLRSLGTGVVSCPDGFRRDDLPTHWAMTGNMIQGMGKMVPAPVKHQYCDNAVRDVAYGANAYAWLPDHLVEHVHYLAGKVAGDEQYHAVNSVEQYASDGAAYALWTFQQLRKDVAKVRTLREAFSD